MSVRPSGEWRYFSICVASVLPPAAALIQPFLPAVTEEGELSLLYFGGRFSHALIKRPKAGDYRTQGQHGAVETGIDAPQGALEAALEDGTAVDCAIASSLSDTQKFWRLRECIPELMSALKPTVNFDCGLPWAEIAGFVQEIEARLTQRYPDATHLFLGHLQFAHAAGVFGQRLVAPLRPEQVRAVAQLLGASPAPLPLPAIEASFKGKGPWKKGLPRILDTLEALGRARQEGGGWRG